MVFGQHIPEEFRKEYNTNKLSSAKEAISSFPNIQKVVNIDNFFEVNRIENGIINSLSNSEKWGFWLQTIEAILKDFLPLLNRGSYEEFISKLNSDDPNQSEPTLVELFVFNMLAKKFGIKKIKPYPILSNGQKTDFLIQKEGGIYVEVTILGENKPAQDLSKLYDECSKELFSKLPCSKYSCKLPESPIYLIVF